MFQVVGKSIGKKGKESLFYYPVFWVFRYGFCYPSRICQCRLRHYALFGNVYLLFLFLFFFLGYVVFGEFGKLSIVLPWSSFTFCFFPLFLSIFCFWNFGKSSVVLPWSSFAFLLFSFVVCCLVFLFYLFYLFFACLLFFVKVTSAIKHIVLLLFYSLLITPQLMR